MSYKIKISILFILISVLTFSYVNNIEIEFSNEKNIIINPLSSDDNQPPTIISSYDSWYVIDYYSSHNVEWTLIDNYTESWSYYDIIVDDIFIHQYIPWSNETIVTESIDPYKYIMGYHNFTIIAFDGEFYSQSTIMIEITNDAPTVLVSSSKSNYIFIGMDEPIITFTISADPNINSSNTYYEIFKDDIQLENGSWSINDYYPIIVSTNISGSYTYKINVNDGYGQTTTQIYNIVIYSNTNPYITHPDDYLVYRDESTTLSWIITDTSIFGNVLYDLYINGELVQEGSWTVSTPIVAAVDTTIIGVYNYTLIIYDGLGGSNNDTIMVEIIEKIINTDNLGNPNYIGIIISLLLISIGIIMSIISKIQVNKKLEINRHKNAIIEKQKQCKIEKKQFKNGHCI